MLRPWNSKISAEERIKLAKDKTQRLVDKARVLLRVRSTNEILLHTDIISKQIPNSHAAYAFNALGKAMHEHELTRLCALWDRVRNDNTVRDRDSIPAVVWLVDHPDVESHLCKEMFDRFAGGFSSPPQDGDPLMHAAIVESYKAAGTVRGDVEAAKVSQWLSEAKKLAGSTNTGDLLGSVRDYRDQNIAHILSSEFAKPKVLERKAKYGDEKVLFDITIDVVGKLHLAVNGAEFMWDDAVRIETRNAEAFWHGVRVEVLE